MTVTDRPRRTIAVAVTGASGALYATRTLAALLERGCHLEVIISDYGRRLLRDELGERASVDKLVDYLTARYGETVRSGTFTLHSNKDLGAKIASGSQDCEAMVVVPCSMKTLAGIAHGLSRNLVERAADVMLKERRPLIIVPRETPMSLPQLRNMVLCAEAGAMVMPAMPAFYQMPTTIDDLADFMTGKILAALGFRHELYPIVEGREVARARGAASGAEPASERVTDVAQDAVAHRRDVRRDCAALRPAESRAERRHGSAMARSGHRGARAPARHARPRPVHRNRRSGDRGDASGGAGVSRGSGFFR